MADDWWTPEHEAAAPDGFLSNPAAAPDRRRAGTMTDAMTSSRAATTWHGTPWSPDHCRRGSRSHHHCGCGRTFTVAQASQQAEVLAQPHDIIYCREWVGGGATWMYAVREAERLIRQEMPWADPIEWFRFDDHHWTSAACGEALGYRLIPTVTGVDPS